MIVGELIELLKNQSPENEVLISRDGEVEDIWKVEEDDLHEDGEPPVKATFLMLYDEQ